MAIKQRVLDKLTAINKELPGALQAGVKGMLATMHKAMVEARDLCHKGLPESRYTDYGELFDGILLAIAQLSEGQVNPAKAEMLSLSQDLLQALINKIQTEGDFKKEIVFLPYKSSMWDSLESVWRAANDDKEHCLAYVVAIPYCDRNPDGSPREWHCEKDMFPKDVPVQDWQSIDLATMHPEVIFIHNPYDQNNLVTSVDSHYYSSTLKDQTDKLVYIPYFVLGEPEFDGKTDEEIEKIEEGIENFVTVPAVLNAHQVIVQSEAMRRVYIDVLTRRTNVKDRAFWETRILGLGSPKFDKLATTKKEELEIPEEWRRIIQKPDGTWKKIIFYNTGLTALLQHNEKMLAKMRQVFQTFKEHKDEVALLWRPHPLIPATIHSMRPQLAEEYDRIVAQYKQEGWGIYDDSADVDRAVMVSDAYYGDGSSVVQIYQKTGKPVIIENVASNEMSKEDYLCLNFVSGVYIDDSFYFASWNTNGLFRVNTDWTSAELIDFFPEQKNVSRFLYSKIIDYKDLMFFIPTNGRDIYSYDLKGKQWNIFQLDEKQIATQGPQFTNAHLIDGTIWLKPYCAHTIVSFQSDKGECSYYSDWFDEIKSDIKEASGPLFGGDALVGEKIYFTFRLSNKVVCFDTRTKKHSVYPVGRPEDSFEAIAFDGESFWLYSQNGDLLQWDGRQNVLTRVENIFGDKREAAGLLYDDGNLWVISMQKDDIAFVNIQTGEISFCHEYMKREMDVGYPSAIRHGDKILLYPNQCKYLFEIDRENKEIKAQEIRQTKDDYKKLIRYLTKKIKEQLQMNGLFPESLVSNMVYHDDAIDMVMKMIGKDQGQDSVVHLCGGRILNCVMSF